MQARKFLKLAPIAAFLTMVSTASAYTCYFEYQSIFAPRFCTDGPSGVNMFKGERDQSPGFPITWFIKVSHTNAAVLPNALKFTAFGFDSSNGDLCGIFPEQTVYKSGGPNSRTKNCYDAAGNSIAPAKMSIYHYD